MRSTSLPSPRRLLAALVTLAALAGSVVAEPVAGASEAAAPILWEGEIRTPHGRPVTAAEVVAYVRPPASQLEPGDALVPIARTTTDGSGHYTLRAVPSEIVRNAADAAGWVTVMVTASSEEGMTLAVDAVAWQPEAPYGAKGAFPQAASRGLWVTSPAERFATRDQGGYRTAAVDGQEAELVDPAERPSVLVLSRGGFRPTSKGAAPTRAGRSPEAGCSVSSSKDIGVSPIEVGELHLNGKWGGEFTYTNTRTTSFQIGVSQDGGPWKVGGSVSMDSKGKFGGDNAPVGDMRFWRYKAHMQFKRFTWFCGWEYQYYFVDTLEPVSWTGGMDEFSAWPPPSCDLKFISPVPGRRYFERGNDASTTFEAGISFHGFSGSVTTAVSSSAVYRWFNGLDRSRNLCGSTNFPTKHTRVMSWA